jgi:CBS domain containing-hemolysin-like protein
MEDLLETMLGIEIVDESDVHVDMQERARELWRLRADTARSAGDIGK